MDQNQRRARVINMRQGRPLPPRRPQIPAAVFTDLDTIDAATDDPAIHAATARIRTALDAAPSGLAPTQAADTTEEN